VFHNQTELFEMTKPFHVFLAVEHAANRRRWTQWLDKLPDAVLVDPEVGDFGNLVEVIVTDRVSAATQLCNCRDRLATGEIGVIATGRAGPGDVALPSDATCRELELACRLLAQIVRLRSERRAGQQRQAELQRLTLTDALTGLPNRRGWEKHVASRIGAQQHRHTPVCVAVFDLDHFKKINDRYGHTIGDAVLRFSGRALAGSVRENDLVARLGGDEFALMLDAHDRDTAQRVVDRVRRSLRVSEAESDLPAIAASAGFSLGTAMKPEDATGLLETADAALRQAKAEGRDRTVFRDLGKK
jgi:diguanylate cyclase (GGDEF)-like protein